MWLTCLRATVGGGLEITIPAETVITAAGGLEMPILAETAFVTAASLAAMAALAIHGGQLY